MAYSSASQVFSYCRDILSGSTAFSASTAPTSNDVARWESAGYSRLNRALSGKGYAVPVSSAATCYDELVELEALYAAAMAHTTRNIQQTSSGATTKGAQLMAQFKDGLKDLLSSDLSLAGLTLGTAPMLYAGGLSISDKEVDEADSDLVKPSFYRGLHDDRSISWGAADTGKDDED